MDIVFPQYERFTTKVLFYRIPKNASTSIYNHLGNTNVIKANIGLIAKNVDERIYKNIFEPSHVKPEELKSFGILNVKDYFSFVVVRNPWDRIVSMYNFSLLNKDLFEKTYGIKNMGFLHFCRTLEERKDDKFFIGSHKQISWIDPKNPPDKILRFESLQEDFSNMIEEINLIGVNKELPHRNRTDHEHYSTYYNPETIEIISKVFEEDIDSFKYTFERDQVKKEENKKGFLKI